MTSQRLPNYLKAHRKRSGLTQRDVAFLLGKSDGAQLSRYEKYHRVPPLETALAFEAIFKVPVAELFGGLHDCVRNDVAGRMTKLSLALRERNPSDSMRMGKLNWLAEHRCMLDAQDDSIT